jgi:hypothetical protein
MSNPQAPKSRTQSFLEAGLSGCVVGIIIPLILAVAGSYAVIQFWDSFWAWVVVIVAWIGIVHALPFIFYAVVAFFSIGAAITVTLDAADYVIANAPELSSNVKNWWNSLPPETKKAIIGTGKQVAKKVLINLVMSAFNNPAGYNLPVENYPDNNY